MFSRGVEKRFESSRLLNILERAVSLLIREKSWVRKTRKQENTKMKGLEKEP